MARALGTRVALRFIAVRDALEEAVPYRMHEGDRLLELWRPVEQVVELAKRLKDARVIKAIKVFEKDDSRL